MKDSFFGLADDAKPVMPDEHAAMTAAEHCSSRTEPVRDMKDLEFSEFGRDQRIPHGAAVLLLVSVIAAAGTAGLLFAVMRWILS